MPSHHTLTRNEFYVALALLDGAAIWLFTPVVAQPVDYFPFAYQRILFGIPSAADVLSNQAFAVVGLLGLFRLQQRQRALEPAPGSV